MHYVGKRRSQSLAERYDIVIGPQRRQIQPHHDLVPLATLLRTHDIDCHLVGGDPRPL